MNVQMLPLLVTVQTTATGSDVSPKALEESADAPDKVVEKLLTPDSDDTRSVSSASSTSQDLSTTFTIPSSTTQPPFINASYEIDPFIIEKHRRRDRMVVTQLQEAGELSRRLEDILPNVQFLR